MEGFKKDIFFRENGTHLKCQSIDENEMVLLTRFLKYELGNSFDPDNFFIVAKDHFGRSTTFESLEYPDDIKQALNVLGLLYEEEVFIYGDILMK